MPWNPQIWHTLHASKHLSHCGLLGWHDLPGRGPPFLLNKCTFHLLVYPEVNFNHTKATSIQKRVKIVLKRDLVTSDENIKTPRKNTRKKKTERGTKIEPATSRFRTAHTANWDNKSAHPTRRWVTYANSKPWFQSRCAALCGVTTSPRFDMLKLVFILKELLTHKESWPKMRLTIIIVSPYLSRYWQRSGNDRLRAASRPHSSRLCKNKHVSKKLKKFNKALHGMFSVIQKFEKAKHALWSKKQENWARALLCWVSVLLEQTGMFLPRLRGQIRTIEKAFCSSKEAIQEPPCIKAFLGESKVNPCYKSTEYPTRY